MSHKARAKAKDQDSLAEARERNFDVSEFPNLGRLVFHGNKYGSMQQFPFKLKNLTNPPPEAQASKSSRRCNYPSDFYDQNLPELEMLKIANDYPKMLLSQIGHERPSVKKFLEKRNKLPYETILRAESAGMERSLSTGVEKFSSAKIAYSRLENVIGRSGDAPKHVSKSRIEYEERLDAALSVSLGKKGSQPDLFKLADMLHHEPGLE